MNGPAARILVVDDEPTIRRVVQAYLEKEGYSVIAAADGESAWQAFVSSQPALVILDLMLPGISGWDLCRRMQAHRPEVPVIMLTARGEETDRIVGLRLGADDYVTKPFSPAELVARVQAVLRRVDKARPATAEGGNGSVPAAEESILTFGPLCIDPASFEARVDDNPVELTPSEFRLLLRLARNPNRVLSRGQLVDAIAGENYAGYERNVDTHIKNLRRKLAAAGLKTQVVETVYGVGYRFRPSAPRPVKKS